MEPEQQKSAPRRRVGVGERHKLGGEASAWRLMLGLGAAPPALILCGLWWMPESPRWLLMRNSGDVARASAALRKLRGTDDVAEELAAMRDGLARERESDATAASAGSGAGSGGEISTHVISKLGKPSVAGATVRVMHNTDFNAGVLSKGWTQVRQAKLSENGGVDDLVPPGQLKRGLYLIEYDFAGVDSAARQIYRKEPTGKFSPLNPSGFFLAAKSTLTLKIEDPSSNNHLVLSVGDKELVARPGVRAH